MIGGTSVLNANLKVPDMAIRYRDQILKSSMSNMITNGNRLPCALLLYYNPMQITLDTAYPFQYLEPYLDIIIKSAKDMVVYGRRAHSNRCDVFEKIQPNFINKEYILRDFDESKTSIFEYFRFKLNYLII